MMMLSITSQNVQAAEKWKETPEAKERGGRDKKQRDGLLPLRPTPFVFQSLVVRWAGLDVLTTRCCMSLQVRFLLSREVKGVSGFQIYTRHIVERNSKPPACFTALRDNLFCPFRKVTDSYR